MSGHLSKCLATPFILSGHKVACVVYKLPESFLTAQYYADAVPIGKMETFSGWTMGKLLSDWAKSKLKPFWSR